MNCGYHLAYLSDLKLKSPAFLQSFWLMIVVWVRTDKLGYAVPRPDNHSIKYCR